MSTRYTLYIIAGSRVFTRVNLGFVKWYGVSSDGPARVFLLELFVAENLSPASSPEQGIITVACDANITAAAA